MPESVRNDKRVPRSERSVLRPDNGGPARASAAEVYPPREDTHLLLRYTTGVRGQRVLDVGTGSGALALAAARAGARVVVATDRNPHALRLLHARARAGRLAIDPVRTDLAAGVRAFDRILLNPPYLPTPAGSEDPDPWHDLALNGGPDGLAPTRRFLANLSVHLRPGGAAFVVVSSLQPAKARAALYRAWREEGGTVDRLAHSDLNGERLEVVRFRDRRRTRPTRRVRRGPRSPRTASNRPPAPPRRRRGSNPDGAPGRTNARGGASTRRRSPRGS